jgi:hypothetical protein
MNNPQPDRRRSDPASRLAYFLNAYRAPEGLSEEERRAALNAAISKHFPGITDEQRIRGYQIVTELMQAEAAEMGAEASRLEVELRRRKKSEPRRSKV